MRLAQQITLILILVAAATAFSSTLPAVKPPELLRFVAPNYSLDAGSTLPDEKLTAVVTVNADGTVRDVTIKEAAGNRLTDVLVTAVRKWVFLPALRNGEAIPVKISIPFSFDSQSHELSVDLGHYMGQ
jgi:TonB family protein